MKKITRLILLITLTINYSILADSIPFRNVIYYGEWSVYNKFYPSSMDPKIYNTYKLCLFRYG